jgi:ring-1,2-phenylacetyl-CoA epoxidase subunit PaaC
MFAADAVDEAAEAAGLGPSRSALREPWQAEMAAVFDEARLVPPADSAFRSNGSRGVHTEYMGYLLADLQHLQRSFPGGVW